MPDALPESIADTLAAAGLTLDALSTSETIRAPLASASAADAGTGAAVGESITMPGGPEPLVDAVVQLPTLRVAEAGSGDSSAELILETRLGRGGMGEVWSARHAALDRVVAIKRLHRETTNATLIALLEEARITAKLDHGHIVPIHFVARDQHGAPIVAMKRVDGRPWRDVLPTSALEDDALAEAVAVLVEVARALELAHSRGVVHRDVKPENVMVGQFGEVYLVDWGLAVRTDGSATAGDAVDGRAPGSRSGSGTGRAIVGTPGFMAPEMLTGEPPDERTDVYLLGATLHRLLTGTMRHAAPTVLEALARAALSEPHEYDESVPADLVRLANAACAVEPAHRPPSATAFRESLEAWLDRRAAFALIRTADARLEQLDALLDQADESDGADATHDERVRTLFTQTRFGYQQVLEGWPDLREAALAHDRAIRTMLDWELRHGSPRAARSLLGSLHDPDEDARRRVEAKERGAAERQFELEARAREADLRTGGRSRARLGLLFVAFCLLVTGAVLVTIGLRIPSPGELVAIMGGLGGVVLGAVWLFRAQLRESLHNRQLARVLVFAIVAILLHRVFGLFNGRAPHVTLATDMLFLGLACGGIAMASRVATPLAIATLGAATLATAIPERTMEIFAITVMVIPFALAGDWWLRHRRDGGEPNPDPLAVEPVDP